MQSSWMARATSASLARSRGIRCFATKDTSYCRHSSGMTACSAFYQKPNLGSSAEAEDRHCLVEAAVFYYYDSFGDEHAAIFQLVAGRTMEPTRSPAEMSVAHSRPSRAGSLPVWAIFRTSSPRRANVLNVSMSL